MTLVLLLVVTVVGIAGMAGTVLQERMAGNLASETQMFETTEAALRRCADRVVAGNSTASGKADSTVITNFGKGQSVSPANAEFHAPDGFGQDLSAQGGSGFGMACLIEFDGSIDAARVGDSLTRPAPPSNVVGYTVTARGARVPPDGGAATYRPSVILEARVILRR